MKRPSEDLLNEFYELAELNEENRLEAVKRFLENKEFITHKSYVLERLIQGLSSSRAGSRLGFSTLLTLLLKEYHTKISIEEIFKIVDEKLDLTKPDASDFAIAQHLVYLSISSSEAYQKSLPKIVARQLKLIETFPFLKFSITQSLVDLCSTLDEEVFSNQIFPFLKEKLCKKLSQLEPEEFLLIMGAKDRFGELLSKESKLVTKSGKFHLKEAHFSIFIEKLKHTESVGRLPMALAILQVGRENQAFERVYQEVVEKYAIEGDEVKTVERYLTLSKDLIFSVEISPNEINTIFSEKLVIFMRKYAHRSDPKFRFAQPLIESVLSSAETRILSSDFPATNILQILERLDLVENGNFDTKVGIPAKKFTEILIGQLDEKSMKKFLKKAFLPDSWSIHRCISAFPQLSPKIKMELILGSARFETKSEGYFNVLCAFIESMFDVKFHHKKFSMVVVKEEDEKVLREVANQLGFEVEAEGKFSRLTLLPIILRLLALAAYLPDDGVQYIKDAEEAELCLKTMNYGVFIDLLVSILTRRQKVHKAIVYYAFYLVHDNLKRSHLKQILEVIGKSDKEISGEADEEDMEDDEFAPITEEDLIEVKKKRKTANDNDEEEQESEDDVESEDDSDEEELVIKPELVKDIKKALGKAALPTNVKEVDDDLDMDDEALLKLDDALAEAFRKHTATHRRLLKEDTRIFRAKLFDLVTIYFSLATIEKLLPLFPTLLELSNKCNKNKTPELSAKISALITNLTSQKKQSVPEQSILKCLNKIQKLAEDLETHETRLVAGKMVAFLLHLSIDEEPTFSKHVRGWLDILLNAYMVETQKHNTYGDILLAVFQRYPDRLVKYLPSLIEYGFNKDIGYPKKIDALQYTSCFMRKDLKRSTDPKIQKLFLAAAKTLATDLHRLLDTLQNKFAKEDKAHKHHLAKALQLLSNFAHFASDLYKETLKKGLPTSKVEELLVLLQPLKSAVQNEFEGLKFENFVKRLHQRLYQ